MVDYVSGNPDDIDGSGSEQLESLLLVDDSPVNLRILFKTLQGCGYKLHLAENGKSALELAATIKPALILLDIVMPDMDGYEVCEILKSSADTKDIAVIFLSALEDSSAKVKGFSVGGVDYISKPFQPDEVVARVRNHIKIHQLERQLARRNLELESENYQILNAISEGIIAIDKGGNITILNPSATVITGWTEEDCIGEQFHGLGLFNTDESYVIPEHQTLPYSSYRMGSANYSDMEIIRRKDQRLVSVTLSSTPRAEGGAVIVLRDISDWVKSEENLRYTREQLESQRQNMAHMERLSTTGEMAAGIAHEVNQPLTAIANYSGVAKRLLDNDVFDKSKMVDLLNKLQIQSKRASDVIQRMRGFVKKPNAGPVQADINDLLKDVIALAEVDSRINDVGINFKPGEDLPLVSIDVVQIQQVALNLLRNGMESMVGLESRQRGVFITAWHKDSSVTVEIIDSGAGVEESAKDTLFTPFVTTKSTGMGIGLSICQSIVQAHGGKIGFRSNKDGVGSTFFFTLCC
jgi:two-component system sensor kinase FixL